MGSYSRYFARCCALVAVCAVGIFTIVASGGDGGGQATTGVLTVTLGYGARNSTSYTCMGSGTVTATQGTTNKSMPYGFSGNSLLPNPADSTPACQTTVIFQNMAIGSWTVFDGVATCPATVTAGKATVIKIWDHVCF